MSLFVEKSFEIINERGMHARASAKFVAVAQQFNSEIFVDKDGIDVPATSILGLLLLCAVKGSIIRISAKGEDADQAIKALGNLIQSRFTEEK